MSEAKTTHPNEVKVRETLQDAAGECRISTANNGNVSVSYRHKKGEQLSSFRDFAKAVEAMVENNLASAEDLRVSKAVEITEEHVGKTLFVTDLCVWHNAVDHRQRSPKVDELEKTLSSQEDRIAELVALVQGLTAKMTNEAPAEPQTTDIAPVMPAPF